MTIGRIPSIEGGIQPTLLTTAGDTLYASSASNPARLGIGTAGQVLTVNSGATAPEWVTPSSGGMTLLSTTTLSGVSTTISSISGSYNNLQMIFEDMTVSSNATVSFRINNSSTLHFQYYLNKQSATVGIIGNSSGSLTGNENMDAASSLGRANLSVNFYNYAAGKRFSYDGVGVLYAGGWCGTWFAGGYEGTTAMSSIVILASAGTLAGTLKIYGVK